MGNLSSYLDKDAFAKFIGVRLLASDIDYSKCELVIRPEHKNGLGGVHGGLIYAFADVTFAVACNSERSTVGLQGDIRYLNKPAGIRLIAECNLISKSRKLSHYQVTIGDDEGILVAQMTGTSYRLPTKPAA